RTSRQLGRGSHLVAQHARSGARRKLPPLEKSRHALLRLDRRAAQRGATRRSDTPRRTEKPSCEKTRRSCRDGLSASFAPRGFSREGRPLFGSGETTRSREACQRQAPSGETPVTAKIFSREGETQMTSPFLGEFMGTLVLVLLGDGV